MVQSVLNSYCLTSKSCCFCITLKTGTMLIAVAGFLLSFSLLYAFSTVQALLVAYGVPAVLAQVIRHVYGVLGVLVGAVNVMLIVASVTYNEKQILLYLWFACVYFLLDITMITTISIISAVHGYVTFAFCIFSLEVCYWIFLYVYIFPVVNGFRKNIHTIVIFLE